MQCTPILSTKQPPTAAELQHLFKQTDWANTRSLKEIDKLLLSLDGFVAVRHGSALIGFGRLITDGIFRALLEDIIMDEQYRGQGIGRLIVKKLLEQIPDIETVYLNTAKELGSFYAQFDFKESQDLTMKRTC